MASTNAVWGIDIGQSALKALRCRPHETEGRIIAEAFDYIEYPQILSEPGADPYQLVRDALATFLSRNSVKGDTVAVAVPGQNGLARFIKLPPVEASKIPDMVRYEARQQIPFDLNDVIWDFQRMAVGPEEAGFALETEIGIFAMKKEQVGTVLEPFRRAKIDVDILQLAPLALYNFVNFDQLSDLPPPSQDADAQAKDWVVVLSLGTDASDLVATNGYRIWQRSIPIGGNHFTKALTKELKLTFAKAEHLKRNATAAQDPKAVFQAMRPVFNDLLTEVNRSINFFSNNVERDANVQKIIAVGNATKLPGLRKYLEQNLGLEVAKVDAFHALVGPAVVNAPAFAENLSSFAVSYGLALQGLGKAILRTSLLPPDVSKARIIREKKPWAVAAAAVLLLGLTISFAGFARALSTVDTKKFSAAENQAKSVTGQAGSFKNDADQAKSAFEGTDKIGQNLVGNVEGRILWLELLRALNDCLPRDAKREGDAEKPIDIDKRNQLHITSVDCQWTDNLAGWYANRLNPTAQATPGTDATGQPAGGDQPAPPPASEPAPGAAPAGGAPAAGEGPTGAGWVIRLKGVHFHNGRDERTNFGAQYVRNTLIKNLQQGKVLLPTPDGKTELVSMKDLGVSFPILVDPPQVEEATAVNPYAEGSNAHASMPVRVFRFDVQFAWQPTSPSARQQKKIQAAQAAQAAANP